VTVVVFLLQGQVQEKIEAAPGRRLKEAVSPGWWIEKFCAYLGRGGIYGFRSCVPLFKFGLVTPLRHVDHIKESEDLCIPELELEGEEANASYQGIVVSPNRIQLPPAQLQFVDPVAFDDLRNGFSQFGAKEERDVMYVDTCAD
jgi:hypothetical protein